MSANRIALLPILSTQKNTYNFKELSSQVSSFVDSTAKAMLAVPREQWSQEFLAELIQQQIALAYGDKHKKDKSNRPEQAKSAYIFFCTDKRQKVREEHPDMDSKEITVRLAQMWKETTEEEKQPYVQQHLKDKQKVLAARDSDSDSEPIEKPKRVRKVPKPTGGFATTSGFVKDDCVKFVNKKTVKELQDFIVWIQGAESAPENLKTMKKPVLSALAMQIMETNNFASF